VAGAAATKRRGRAPARGRGGAWFVPAV
jgi:hypothetical protein